MRATAWRKRTVKAKSPWLSAASPQNRLNSEADALPCEHAEENAAVSARFGFGRLSGIELMLGNNVKLLDDNRERRRSEYSFLIKGVSVTFTT